MASDKELTRKKHLAVQKEFKRLNKILTKTGKKKYTYAAVVEKVADKFFYTTTTVEIIVSQKEKS